MPGGRRIARSAIDRRVLLVVGVAQAGGHTELVGDRPIEVRENRIVREVLLVLMVGEARRVDVAVVVALVRVEGVVVEEARRPVDAVVGSDEAAQLELLRELLVLRRIPSEGSGQRRAVGVAAERVVEIAVRGHGLEVQVVGDVPIEVDLQTGVLELVPVRRDAPGQRVLAEAVVARVLVRRLETPVELPAGTEHRDRDVVVPVVDLRRDAGRHAGVGAQLHGVLVGRALLVAVGQVGDDIDLDSIRREKANRDAARLHVLVAEVVDDAAARVGGAEHAAEPYAADRGVGVRGVRDPRGIQSGRAPRPAARRRSCPRRRRDRPRRASPLR